MRRKAVRGEVLGRPPYGYRVGPRRKLELISEEALVVRYIFRLYLQDGLGIRRIAGQLGAVDATLSPADGNVAEQIRSLTGGRGADVCIEATGAYPALHEAIRSAAYSAKVVTLGFFQGQGQGLFLGEEFHHNRVNVVCSQIYGVSPELTYRWNRERLIQTAMQLQADGVLNLRPIITQVLPFAEAAEAFRLCDLEPEKTVQVVLDFTV